jgi:hypothetical protein
MFLEIISIGRSEGDWIYFKKMPSGSLEGIRPDKDRCADIKHRKTFEGSEEG